MFKRISCLALILALLLGVFVQQVTATTDHSLEGDSIAQTSSENLTEAVPSEPEPEIEIPESPGIFIDGTYIDTAAPTLIEDTTYVALRSMVQALRPDAVVTWEEDHAAVTAEDLSVAVYPNENYIEANGRFLFVPSGVQILDGCTMLPVRTIAKVFGATVEWNPDDGKTYITSGAGALLSGDEYYQSDVVYWLSRIINSESGNQPLDGKVAVGNVILNRVSNPIFPNTVYEVIFQKNQFAPTRSGTIHDEPNAESLIAAKLCLDGAVVLSDALWFNPAGVSCWASKHKSLIATIGDHAFYG